MQAAYLFGTRDLRFVEREPLPLRPDDVRVAVASSGICGTDLHVYGGMAFLARPSESAPLPMGHEFSGRVVEVGEAVTTFRVGQRVTAIPNSPCGTCALCRGGRASVCQSRVTLRSGSWAPTLVLPAQNVFVLPDEVSDRRGALTEPLACAVRAVDRAEPRPGDRVCIVGGGPIGLLLAAVAKASGASTVIVAEPRAYRRDLATRLGADVTLDPTGLDLTGAVRDLTDGLGADVVFEVVGQPSTIEQALALVAPGGTAVIVGVTDATARAAVPTQDFYLKEITIRGTKGPTHAVERAIRWLARLDLDPLITHTFALERLPDALDLGLTGNAGKIMVEP